MYIQGTLFIHALNVATSRFIPVYTRNTNTCESAFTNVEVYPCVYRKHTAMDNLIRTDRGLSLCIQGTHNNRIHNKIFHRFIPVYTGNTSICYICDKPLTVYPCVYRERRPTPPFLIERAGLSLCIQGTPKRLTSTIRAHRFIPVYTGNATSPFLSNLGAPVYPCVYRER